ncbi:hypothetical protein HPB49_022406 [Dermacentor silvarum]|uniref:Uncharacterized protein n=1 Tax=Dermacentor silvarum TaxID=543639 RepID=A0ACB8D081_DERSI|nr:hypothetical protein HPB49_022406 [Dermacentor silvarum]
MSSTVPPEGPLRWNRTGVEQLKLEEDEALLSGWHEVIRWFLSFLLSSPKDAMFLRRLNNKTDMIETMDLYLQYEPQVFLVTFSGLVYTVTGFFGSVVYVMLRRRKRCGGDLTQDINENMRCVLQVYTAAYIVVLAGILLGSLLMLAGLFELGQSVAAEGNNFQESLREVEYYIRNASNVSLRYLTTPFRLSRAIRSADRSQVVDNQRRVDVLAALIKKLQNNFQDIYTTFAVPHVKVITSANVSGKAMMMLGLAADMPPEMEEQQQPSPQPGVPPEEYMARFMAQRVAEVYNLTITDTVDLALETSALASDFSRMLIMDAAVTVPGFDKIQPSLEQADALGVLKARIIVLINCVLCMRM